jgi:hypothetical protein
MNIKYELNEIHPKVFLVMIDDPYDLAMTFCRVQEYYESPFKQIKGKSFNKAEFQRMYANKFGEGLFTYPVDWAGFNVPCTAIWGCYNLSSNETDYDLYDDLFLEIWDDIEYEYGILDDKNYYVIGSQPDHTETIDHEICHAFYFLNKEYKKKADAITATIPNEIFDYLKNQLIDLGYCGKVMKDEIQAYLSTDAATIANTKVLKKLKTQINKYKTSE